MISFPYLVSAKRMEDENSSPCNKTDSITGVTNDEDCLTIPNKTRITVIRSGSFNFTPFEAEPGGHRSQATLSNDRKKVWTTKVNFLEFSKYWDPTTKNFNCKWTELITKLIREEGFVHCFVRSINKLKEKGVPGLTAYGFCGGSECNVSPIRTRLPYLPENETDDIFLEILVTGTPTHPFAQDTHVSVVTNPNQPLATFGMRNQLLFDALCETKGITELNRTCEPFTMTVGEGEWKNLWDYDKRAFIPYTWTSFLQRKILENFPTCPFKLRYQRNQLFATGTCIHHEDKCDVKCRLSFPLPVKYHQVIVTVEILGQYNGHSNSKTLHVRGYFRDQMKQHLKSKKSFGFTVSQTSSSDVRVDAGGNLIMGRHVSKKMKHEIVCSEKLCEDPFEALKIKKKQMQETFKDKWRPGFIHDMNDDPFTVLMYCGLGMKAVLILAAEHQAQNSGPLGVTVFFDATGSFMRKYKQVTKRVYLYSMIIHIKESKIILPIFEFLSSCHEWVKISGLLSEFIAVLKQYNTSLLQFLITRINMDNSPALLKSSLEAFNDMGDVRIYLKATYDICILKKEGKIKTVISFCFSHEIHRATRLLKSKGVSKQVKDVFLHAHARLTKAETQEEFETILNNLFYVLLNKSFSVSVEKKALMLKGTDQSLLHDSEDLQSEYKYWEIQPPYVDPEADTIRESSGFYHYIQGIKYEMSTQVEMLGLHLCQGRPNPFYSPAAVEIFVENFSSHLSLWAKFCLKMLGHGTNLTSGPMEKHFGNSKHNVPLQARLPPAEIPEQQSQIVVTAIKHLAHSNPKNTELRNLNKKIDRPEKPQKMEQEYFKERKGAGFYGRPKRTRCMATSTEEEMVSVETGDTQNMYQEAGVVDLQIRVTVKRIIKLARINILNFFWNREQEHCEEKKGGGFYKRSKRTRCITTSTEDEALDVDNIADTELVDLESEDSGHGGHRVENPSPERLLSQQDDSREIIEESESCGKYIGSLQDEVDKAFETDWTQAFENGRDLELEGAFEEYTKMNIHGKILLLTEEAECCQCKLKMHRMARSWRCALCLKDCHRNCLVKHWIISIHRQTTRPGPAPCVLHHCDSCEPQVPFVAINNYKVEVTNINYELQDSQLQGVQIKSIQMEHDYFIGSPNTMTVNENATFFSEVQKGCDTITHAGKTASFPTNQIMSEQDDFSYYSAPQPELFENLNYGYVGIPPISSSVLFFSENTGDRNSVPEPGAFETIQCIEPPNPEPYVKEVQKASRKFFQRNPEEHEAFPELTASTSTTTICRIDGSAPNASLLFKKYKNYSADDMNAAIASVVSGLNALEAAKQHGIPPRTLYYKIKALGIKQGKK